MEKTKSVICPRARVSSAQPGGVKRRPKAAKPTVNLDLYRANLPRMIDQIQEEAEVHSGQTTELKAELEKVTNTTLHVLREVQELRNILESLRGNGQEEDVPFGVPAARRKESAGALAGPDDGLKKILIIDDDSTTINIIAHFLQKEDYRVSTSLSGIDGLKKAFKESPDLILLDVMMPDLNGFQFLSIYRKDKENARTPVVILSSLSEEADVLKGLEIGAVDYITKPFSPQVLMAKIKKNLNSGP